MGAEPRGNIAWEARPLQASRSDFSMSAVGTVEANRMSSGNWGCDASLRAEATRQAAEMYFFYHVAVKTEGRRVS